MTAWSDHLKRIVKTVFGTQKAAAGPLGCSQGQVSKILNAAVEKDKEAYKIPDREIVDRFLEAVEKEGYEEEDLVATTRRLYMEALRVAHPVKYQKYTAGDDLARAERALKEVIEALRQENAELADRNERLAAESERRRSDAEDFQAHAEASQLLERGRSGAAHAALGPLRPRENVVNAFVYRDLSNGMDRALSCQVAFSGTARQAEDLRGQLRHLLHVEDIEGNFTPSLVRCLLPSGEAAVIHRRPRVNEFGQSGTVAYVLVGPAHVLTASGSLLLEGPDWRWCAEASGTLTPPSVTDLQHQIGRNRPRYIEHIGHIRFPLGGVAAQLIRTPQSRLSFTAPRESVLPPGVDFVRLLLWGLCSMFETALSDDFFTYSTLEHTDLYPIGPKGSTGPEIVRVLRDQSVIYNGSDLVRHAVDNPSADETSLLAAKLMELFLASTRHRGENLQSLGLKPNSSRTPQQRMQDLATALRQLPARVRR
ncbi:cell division protein ZapB [Streptomyces sp. NPDC048720]|uniref:cell division protein ZapB n=1 Tax=Streptomyces sp. NPDC048720 TaxID=3365588 RepID=UPI003718A042